MADGHEVVGLARSEGSAGRIRDMGATPHLGDLRDPRSLLEGIKTADAVVHAGFGHDDWSQMDQSFDQDAAAVHTMLDALEGSGRSFIYTSGSGVLGDTGPAAADEALLPSGDGGVRLRGELERIVVDASARGVAGTVLRPGLVFGETGGGVMHMLIDMARRTGAGVTVGEGRNIWSAVHIGDLALAYRKALLKHEGGLFNIANDDVFTMHAIASAIGRMLGFSGEVKQWPLEEARSAIGMLADGLASNKRISADKARNLLDWHPAGPTITEDIETGSYATLGEGVRGDD
jgi:nucleoside-diphosphate-sugar epimerase